ncbi:Histone deacetylase clr3 [Gossypium arboreum]|uniref:Histone deacetylase clr3 n=1 Tax=Gossypium arboreum TaxID=29729 RepID=A0A0B0N732_GOSAR|nr:Histone deacetylase clr3 [Gossypium arboreum]
MVLHVITYRCHYPRQGLTRTHISESHIDVNVLNVVLLAHIYRCHGLTRTSHIGVLFQDICILAIPKVRTGLSDVVTRSNQTRTHRFQAYTYSVSHIYYHHYSFHHI